jgi:serine/threonine-protein kinase
MADLVEPSKTTLADRYLIEREIGRGGMATVYLAEDLKHRRKVAVKILDPELAATLGADRFLREIRVTANLHHPHILPLYDSGRSEADPPGKAEASSRTPHSSTVLFYVMPYVEGESLRHRVEREGSLPVDEALRLAQEVASALDYAHRQDVIHRDIKPENILLHEGMALLADFGIALAVEQAGGERLTQTGSSLGTPAYMSPEQITGERDLDARCDTYALACVLYEMLAGEPPFTGPNARAVLASHLADPAPSVDRKRTGVPGAVASAVDRALSKDPTDRFISARAFSDALAVEAAPVRRATRSIVVLPFENLSPDRDNEYFSDGLTEDVITDLSQLQSLRVISRNSSMLLKGTSKDTRAIGRELDVEYVLEGSVRRAGDRLRVTAQLIDARDDAHVWAERYDGVLDDVFEMQETMSRAIVGALELKLSPVEDHDLSQRPSRDLETYDLYLLGRHHWHRFTEEDIRKAIDYFQRAIELDPSFARAYGGLAAAYFIVSGPGVPGLPAHVGIPKAKAAAEKALALDPNNAFASVALALVFAWYELDWDAAERLLSRLVSSNPGSSEALEGYAMYLSMAGSHGRAMRYISTAIEMDPLWPIYYANAGEILYMDRRFEESLEYCRRALELDDQFIWAHIQTAMCESQMGKHEDAVRRLEEHAGERHPWGLQFLGYAYGRSGRGPEAREVIARLETLTEAGFASAVNTAAVFLGLGEDDRALESLEVALDESPPGSTALAYIGVDPVWDPIRQDPRFQEVVGRIVE